MYKGNLSETFQLFKGSEICYFDLGEPPNSQLVVGATSGRESRGKKLQRVMFGG